MSQVTKRALEASLKKLLLDWVKDGMRQDPKTIITRLPAPVQGNIRAALERFRAGSAEA